MYTAHDGVDQPCYVISRLHPSQPGPNRFPKDTASLIAVLICKLLQSRIKGNAREAIIQYFLSFSRKR